MARLGGYEPRDYLTIVFSSHPTSSDQLAVLLITIDALYWLGRHDSNVFLLASKASGSASSLLTPIVVFIRQRFDPQKDRMEFHHLPPIVYLLVEFVPLT